MTTIRLIAAARIAALGAAGVAALITAAPAAAQGYASLSGGREIFDRVGCNACHSYVSRRAAPSIRDLMRDFSGTPAAIADSTRGSRAHKDDTQFPRVSDADLRGISEWLAGISWPEDTPVASSAPSGTFLADREAGGGLDSFDMAGCNECHGFSARAKAPSIRDMKQEFATEPLAVAQATRGNMAHRDDSRVRDLADVHLRNIAEFISGSPWPEAMLAAAPAAEPAPEPVAAPAVEIPAVALAAPAVAAVAPPARSTAPLARSRVAAIRLEKGKARSDRLTIELRGDEPDMVDLRLEDEQLKVSFSGVRLGENIAPKKDNWPGSHVVSSVEAVDLGGTVDLTISSRVAAWSYRGTQGKRRLVIDLTAAAKQPVAKAAKPAAAVVAKAPTPKPVPKPAPAKPVAAKAAPAKAAATAASTASAAASTATASAAAAATAAASVVAAAPTPAPAAKVAEPPAQIALAKPESTPLAKPAKKARAKNLKYKDGSDLAPCPPPKAEDKIIGAFDEDAVKEIMDRIGCPQCHAYVQKKTGPPFREVIKKYKGDPACVIHRLKTNDTHKEEGVTNDIAASEFKPIADYVATRIK